jgi:hypothetical protein
MNTIDLEKEAELEDTERSRAPYAQVSLLPSILIEKDWKF